MKFHVGQRVQFNGASAKVIDVSSKGTWVQVVHARRGVTIATKLSRAEARRAITL